MELSKYFNSDTSTIMLSYLDITDIRNLCNLSKGDPFYAKNYFDKQIKKYIICSVCNSGKIYYVTGFSFFKYIPEFIPDDMNFPPPLQPMCLKCLGISYHSWLKTNEIYITYNDEDACNWLNVNGEGIIIKQHAFSLMPEYSFHELLDREIKGLNTHNKSNYCIACNKSVCGRLFLDRLLLVSVFEDGELYQEKKYTYTYHIECFIKKFIKTKSYSSFSLTELKALIDYSDVKKGSGIYDIKKYYH